MKIEYAKTLPLRKILFKIGLRPKKQTPTEILFISPFCNNREALLSVTIKENTWLDAHLAKGGDAVELVAEYLKHQGNSHTEQHALRWIKNMMQAPPKLDVSFTPDFTKEDSKFSVRGILPVRSLTLLRYLDKRCIPRNYVAEFLRDTCIEFG